MFPCEFVSRITQSVGRHIERPDITNGRIRRVTVLYCAVGLLHGVLDPGISYVGVEVFEQGWEANPMMRVPMQDGLVTFTLVHIPLYLALLGSYLVTVELLDREPQNGTTAVYRLTLVGLLLLTGWGVWLNVRNLLVLY
ncbi:hypothetical protein DVK02_04190 [Halobellus sp. Atlit-31R]|nr:hypothetical protein DVK02_04190 [Halobellus sp. Atlit-31R]